MGRQSRLQPQEYDKLLNAIDQVYEIHHAEDFPQRVLFVIHKLIPSDYTSYNAIDQSGFKPSTTSKNPRLSALFFPKVSPTQIQMKTLSQYVHQHPTLSYFKKTQDGRPYKFSDFYKRDQFHKSELYNEYYRHMGVEHQINFWLCTKLNDRIIVNLNRSVSDFSERDRLILNLIRPHLVRAYKNIIINTRYRQEQTILESTIEQENKGAIQVDWDGKIHFITGGRSPSLGGRRQNKPGDRHPPRHSDRHLFLPSVLSLTLVLHTFQ